jgi:hypothetical protein
MRQIIRMGMCVATTNLKKERAGSSGLFYSFFLVFNPKGRYKGQVPIKLVTINTPASIRRITARVPEITCVKYRTKTMTATSTLITLSTVPMFFFIFADFKFKVYY